MKYAFILCVILFMTLPQVKAQQSPKVKFEKVSDEEMQMKVYGPDTTAEAVILYDEGRSDVRYQVDKGAFMLTYERFVRIKILKQSGTDWGNFAVSLYSYNQNKEEISGIKGVTFNLEKGKIVKTELKKESISKERENKYWEKERLSLPVVKIGSVIDLRYTIHSPMLWNLRSWNFQYLIPVKWSQYEVEYPEYFNYNHSSMGYHVLNTQNHEAKSVNINYVERSETSQIPVGLDGNRAARKMENRTITYMSQIYSYSAKEVPALKAEPYLTTLDNYTTRIKFELAAIDYSKILGKYTSYTDSWNDIAKELLDDEEFGGQIKSANYAKEEIAGLIAGKKDDKQKVMALYSYIQHAIKYNGDETFSPNSSLRKVFNEKNGNSADVNLLLLAMLTEAGIEAYPVLMSTRSNGLISIVHPSLTDCNYVIVMAMINGAPILLDATEPNLQAGVLPFRCLNGTGRKIKREGVEEVNLTNARPTCYNVVNLEFKEGKFTGNILSRKTGLNAFDFRQSVKNAGGQKEYFEKLRNGSTDIQFDDYSFSNLDSLHLPVMIKYNISLRNESEPGADILYINPILVDRTTKNQFSLPTRVFPIDYGGVSSDIYQLNLIVPEGYKVEELPQSKTFALEGKSGSYNYQVKQTDNTISFSTRLTIDKTLFLPSEYKMLQEFFNIIVSKESEQIVLKKISL